MLLNGNAFTSIYTLYTPGLAHRRTVDTRSPLRVHLPIHGPVWPNSEACASAQETAYITAI